MKKKLTLEQIIILSEYMDSMIDGPVYSYIHDAINVFSSFGLLTDSGQELFEYWAESNIQKDKGNGQVI
jgi:hypothetical protein